MAGTLIQNSAGSVTLFITDSAGAPALGLVDTDVTADIKKEGAAGFSAHALTTLNWTELSGGFYEIDLAITDTDVLGNLHVRVQGGTVRTSLVCSYVIATAPVNLPTVTPPSTVAVFGYVYHPDASPLAGASVSARILGIPTVLHPGSEGLVISQNLVVAKTDSNGFFTVNLISGTAVDFIISAAGYRRTFSVPGVSTNLFDIP